MAEECRTLEECAHYAKEKLGMTVLTPADDDYGKYEEASIVYNKRIRHKPAAIAYCRHGQDVSFWMRRADKLKVPVTVRSGGHHHEGMCAETDSITLDLSKMNGMTGVDNWAQVDLGPAKELGKVVDKLVAKRRVLPVGGCESVCVGGLTHGGGWGASYRAMGATVDKLVEVDMVLPNGSAVTLNRDGIVKGIVSKEFKKFAPRLFWAIRGGGGGNFGVVTRFRFNLEPLPERVCGIMVHWDKSQRLEVAKRWAAFTETSDHRMTTFCRLSVIGSDTYDENNPAVMVGGRFYGTPDECQDVLADLTRGTDWRKNEISVMANDAGDTYFLNSPPGLKGANATLGAGAYALNVGATRVSTCDPEVRQQAHKVTSVMPKGSHDDVMTCVDKFLASSEDDGGNAYISLHGMGGLHLGEDVAFPWRGKPYILQAQAWWEDQPREDTYKKWIARFRKEMRDANCYDGAFINFPDDQITDISEYYGDSYGELQSLKRIYDPNQVMRFRQSIPI